MKPKKYSLIGCCGMSCALCPRFHSTAKSKCLGCGLDLHCQRCPIFRCCSIEKGYETCAECDDFPCDRISRLSDWKGFNTRKCWIRHIKQIKEVGTEKWLREQLEKKKMLEVALDRFNDGKSRSFYCLAFLFLDTDSLKKVLNNAKDIKESDIKKRATAFRSLLQKVAVEKDIEL